MRAFVAFCIFLGSSTEEGLIGISLSAIYRLLTKPGNFPSVHIGLEFAFIMLVSLLSRRQGKTFSVAAISCVSMDCHIRTDTSEFFSINFHTSAPYENYNREGRVS